MLLTRTVRIALVPARGQLPRVLGWQESHGWCAAMEIEVTVRGNPDARTGYIVGIQEIDRATRACAERIIPASFIAGADPHGILPRLAEEIGAELDLPLPSMRLRLHPFSEMALEESMKHMVTLSQRFDFAASHRLHCSDLSNEENRRVFGKCNNPAGHGHNYRLEVEVRVPLSDAPTLRASDIERIVRETAVDRLDHRHLNTDVEAFRERNPSVEAIARTCFDWLSAPLAAAGGDLVRVRLWETEKTSAIYPG
jgi:6-pyruvoyltetrahydropterin/6-carboxytetrahydropterin synthase